MHPLWAIFTQLWVGNVQLRLSPLPAGAQGWRWQAGWPQGDAGSLSLRGSPQGQSTAGLGNAACPGWVPLRCSGRPSSTQSPAMAGGCSDPRVPGRGDTHVAPGPDLEVLLCKGAGLPAFGCLHPLPAAGPRAGRRWHGRETPHRHTGGSRKAPLPPTEFIESLYISLHK